MDIIIESLVAKTLFLLGTQLFITFLATFWLIQKFRHMYLQHHPMVTATKNENGDLDLDISWDAIRKPFFALLALNVITFLVLLFYGESHPNVGFPVFCFWSILTGFELALVLLSVDENLGLRVLRLTALCTFAAAMIGMYSGINFLSLGGFLFVGLGALIVFDFIRAIFGFSSRTQLVGAVFGAVLFVFYLVYDFDRLETMSKYGTENTWNRAFNLAISIYLDIINLFLKILQILSHNRHH